MKKGEISKKFKELLLDLDINSNDKKDIYYVDAIRIEEAFVYNVRELLYKVEMGNRLETYYRFKLSKDKIINDNIFESNIYPKKELQIKDLHYSEDRQFISLSKRQEEVLLMEVKSNLVSIENNNEIDNNHTLKRTK